MTSPRLVALIFWGSLFLTLYTFVGYPTLMVGLGRFFPRRTGAKPQRQFPTVTVVLAVYNEAGRILTKLQNLLNSDYPKEQLDVVVVSDGSTDATVERICSLNEPRVRLLAQPQRCGKAHCLNVALAAAGGEIIVFADTRQHFAPQTVAKLASHFSQPEIGGVSGALEIEPAGSHVGEGIDAYWHVEKLLRCSESRWDSCIGCSGAVYAIRRDLFKKLPSDTLLDDVVIPMQIAVAGYHIAFEPEAGAYDPQTLEPDRETIRKRRTLAGNYQMLFRHLSWLLPWRNRLWWNLISHKYLRLAAPFLLLAMFVANAMLLGQPRFRLLFFSQAFFYLLGACGLACSSRRLFLLSIPAGFVFLNWMALTALWQYLCRRATPAWEKV